jgi:hypothetical protein
MGLEWQKTVTVIKMKKLINRYEKVIDEYVRLFEKKHGLELEFWVSDNKTGVAAFGDIYYFNVSDIIYDIENELPKNFICQWLEDSVEYYERKGQNINLHSYFKGMRYENLPDAI